VHLLTAALLGALQGLTEFLPVSSTAHLLIGERLMAFDDPSGVFTVTIQFGSILAVMWLYRAKILSVVRGLPSDADSRRFAAMILLAFLPAAVAAFFFEKFIKTVLYATPAVIAWAFILGGIVILLAERFRPAPVVHQADQTPFGRALGVGACQTLALIPGVSRSGATIIGGLLLRLDRRAAAEFSFFLAMPTMAAAFVHDLWEVRHHLAAAQAAQIGVGFVMAFVASAVVVGPFLRFVGRSGFAPFAWYRIFAGAAILIALWAGRL
jgi:undecaprenyl-diphosphatase